MEPIIDYSYVPELLSKYLYSDISKIISEYLQEITIHSIIFEYTIHNIIEAPFTCYIIGFVYRINDRRVAFAYYPELNRSKEIVYEPERLQTLLANHLEEKPLEHFIRYIQANMILNSYSIKQQNYYINDPYKFYIQMPLFDNLRKINKPIPYSVYELFFYRIKESRIHHDSKQWFITRYKEQVFSIQPINLPQNELINISKVSLYEIFNRNSFRSPY